MRWFFRKETKMFTYKSQIIPGVTNRIPHYFVVRSDCINIYNNIKRKKYHSSHNLKFYNLIIK